jgi:hypothetical protein
MVQQVSMKRIVLSVLALIVAFSAGAAVQLRIDNNNKNDWRKP